MIYVQGRFSQYHMQQLGWWSPLPEWPVVASSDEGWLRFYAPKGVPEGGSAKVYELLKEKKLEEAKALVKSWNLPPS